MEQLEFDFSKQSTEVCIAPERQVPLLTPAQFETVYTYLRAGELVTSNHIEPKDMGKTFLAIDMGYFRGWQPHELDQIGIIFNHIAERIPAKSGRDKDIDRPQFMTFKMLHKSDYEKMLARMDAGGV